MLPPFDIIEHYRACNSKRSHLTSTISSLPDSLSQPLTASDHSILSTPLPDLIAKIQNGSLSPTAILDTYTKSALLAHKATNCLTEILYDVALEHISSGKINLKGPLAGIPVSLKDSIAVKDIDCVTAYSANINVPAVDDGAMVKVLHELGAVPYVKTNVPTSMLSFSTTNSVFSTTTHPSHNAYTPGGSTGGEAALLALNGSRIGVGSDVAGSVRIPAAWSGCVALRGSTGRWPKWGGWAAQPGQEGVPAVYGAMGRQMGDLEVFVKAVLGRGRGWEYDHTVHPIPWREEVWERARKGIGGRAREAEVSDDDKSEEEKNTAKTKKPLRIGLMLDDNLIPVSPPILRGLSLTANGLQSAGHEIIPIPASSLPTSAEHTLSLSSRLLTADGCTHILSPLHTAEPLPPDASQIASYTRLPNFLKLLHYLWNTYLRPWGTDALWARLLYGLRPLSAAQQWRLVKAREDTRAKWFAWWAREENNWDFILCPVHTLPGMPQEGLGEAVAGCGWTVLWNLLDWTAGVLPVTRVRGDEESGEWEEGKGRKGDGVGSRLREGVMRFYDPQGMKGLPCAVQIVGRRLEEERVLGYMGLVEEVVREFGGEGGFEVLDVVEGEGEVDK